MRRETWIAIGIGVGVPLFTCGGVGLVSYAMRPGHDANAIGLTVVGIVAILAALPYLSRMRKR